LFLIVFYLIAKFITPVITDVLESMGSDCIATKVGVDKIIGDNKSLSKVIGKLTFFFIMFLGLVSALEQIELTGISNLLAGLLELSGQIVFGLVIIAVGIFLANIAYR
jgi:hypothetical protein